MPSTITILTAAGSAIAMVVVGWMSGRATRRVAAIEAATPEYADMDASLRSLRAEFNELRAEMESFRADRDIDRAHIVDVHGWDDYGRPGSMPQAPPWYRPRWAPPREDTQG